MSKQKKAVINNYRVERIPLPGGRNQPKIILQVETVDNKEYEISEILFKKDESEVCQGLWLNLDSNGNIAEKSTLKQLLSFFNAKEISDLKSKEINIRPNEKGYFSVDCC